MIAVRMGRRYTTLPGCAPMTTSTISVSGDNRMSKLLARGRDDPVQPGFVIVDLGHEIVPKTVCGLTSKRGLCSMRIRDPQQLETVRELSGMFQRCNVAGVADAAATSSRRGFD